MKQLRELLACFLCLVVLWGCDNVCGNDISKTIISPSGKLKAVVFNRNCGATTGLNTQVSVLFSTEKLSNEAGNTLILDGSVPLQIEWKSDSLLQIGKLGGAKTFRQNYFVKGISISYGN
jgi:hypothetical protein